MNAYIASLLVGVGVSLAAAVVPVAVDGPDAVLSGNTTRHSGDSGVFRTSKHDLITGSPTEYEDDCNWCTVAIAGNGGRIEVLLAAVEFDGTDSTFTYHVCQDQTSQNLSHWVVGLSPTCCARLLEASGGTSTTGTCKRDPTTGLYGVKFETGSGVPICDGITCGEPGDVFTLTFSGNTGTDCVTIAGKIDGGDSTAYGYVYGPACDYECQTDADCDDGLYCNGAEVCVNGVCLSGTPVDCDDLVDCTDDSCDEANNTCVNWPNDAWCDDDDACTEDRCTPPDTHAPAGGCVYTPVDCNDDNVCTDDSCDPATGCVYVNNTNPCDDGDACTTNDTCSGGACVGGPPLDCDDQNVCTDDSCDPATGCVYVNNTNPCDDGDACTTDDTCSDGTCVGGPPLDCDDQNVCTDDSCDPATGCVHVNNADPCDDGDACTTDDTCSDGTCVGGPPLDCDDQNVCTDDSCDPATGCVHVDNTDPCDDGDACTTNDTCSDGACVGGPPLDCDDQNVCTDDSCDPATGCVHVDNTDPCDDGDACTTNDMCSNGTCVGGPPLDCDDQNVCTDDSCDPATGCVHVDNTDPCDDGDACTTNDMCSNGTCVGGPPLDCDDQNVCTDDSCDPATGCVHVDSTDPCDDGDACTTNDTCAAGSCVGGPPLDCDDQNVCTDDSCDPATGCVHVDNTDPCDDGDACTTNDTCSDGTCVGGPPLDCDDQNVCTDDSCDPASGCVYMNNTDPCDDGDPCTINDICTDGQCVGMLDPENSDDDCAPDACDVCPGRPDCRFDPERSCPDAGFHLAVLEEPSCGMMQCTETGEPCDVDRQCPGGACDGGICNRGENDGNPCDPDVDCVGFGNHCVVVDPCRTTADPPASCEELLGCGMPFFVEIWVTKFSPDLDHDPPDDPGIACAYADLISHVPVENEIRFKYGDAFDAGSGFESGTFDGTGGVMDLGACSTADGGVGIWPEWVLLARIELRQGQGEALSFELQESALFSTSVFGEGSADPVDYGERCDSNVFCRAHMYDVDQDCFVGPGDLACFAGCFGLCPDDPEYDTACCGGSCDCANYVKCSEDDCVGPEDFAFWVTCWLKYCDDPVCILVPGDICDGGPASVEGLPPLPSDSLLRNLGLEPPSGDWKGYQRGILREWQRLEAESRVPKEHMSDREYLRKRRGR